jgi:zinc protease
MRLDDVHEFFRTFYHPLNASLTLAGDIATEAAFALADRYFGEIPAGAAPERVAASASVPAERRLVLEDRVELPRLYMAWHSPAMFAADDAEMDFAADLLANGKSSRLYRSLVYESRLALDVSAFQSSRELSGFFMLMATAAPGRSLTEIAAYIDREIQSLVESGPTADEMERAEAQAESHFIYRLQTVGGFGGKSDQLNAYNVFKHDPAYFGDDLERYRRATADTVRTAARRYLRLDERVTLSVVPPGEGAQALAGSETVSVS